MQITEITIHPTNEDLVRAYVSIVFDNRARILDRSEVSGRALIRRFLLRDRLEAREFPVLRQEEPEQTPASSMLHLF
jgi:hypothetical protein